MIKFDYYFRNEVKTKMMSVCDVIKAVREEKYMRQVSELRESVDFCIANSRDESAGQMSKLPVIHWAEGTDGYTGMVVLTLPVGDNMERMEEFDQITPSQTAYLKHIVQKSDVKWRKMYQDDIEQRHRYAAFCATTNSPTPLTDPTGSRRLSTTTFMHLRLTNMENGYRQ